MCMYCISYVLYLVLLHLILNVPRMYCTWYVLYLICTRFVLRVRPHGLPRRPTDGRGSRPTEVERSTNSLRALACEKEIHDHRHKTLHFYDEDMDVFVNCTVV